MVARAHSIVDMGVAEEVIVAQIDAGASAEIIGFFAFQGCEIVHVTDAGTGLETAFPVGGTITHLDGVTCTADGITVTRARQDSDDASQWSVSATNYLYVPGSAEFQAVTSAAALLTSPADDAAIFATAEFNC
jgi:hypothetical protein